MPDTSLIGSNLAFSSPSELAEPTVVGLLSYGAWIAVGQRSLLPDPLRDWS